MLPGVNVDFVEVTMGLQMRRLRDEEQDASHGGGEGDGDGDHEFCFHVRIPPRKLQSSMEEDGYERSILDDFESSILDEGTSGIGRINIQPMQEIQVRRFVDTGEDGIFSMVARSFVPAPESRR
jgi:hypothetical protein